MTRKKINNWLRVTVFILALVISAFFIFGKNNSPEDKLNGSEDNSENFPATTPNVEIVSSDNDNKEQKNTESSLPEKVFIKIPFTSQAPFAQWDQYHEEACEEASLLMVAYYLKNKPLDRETAEKEIQYLIAFQKKNYGDYRDSDAAGVVRLARDFYGVENLKVIYNFSRELIKQELAKGNPIIIPAAGQLLGNPNFTYPGPLYHNLVLVGYEGNTIITNDPGTRKGEGYLYDINTLYEAIHDFPGEKEKILSGRKAMIVIQDGN